MGSHKGGLSMAKHQGEFPKGDPQRVIPLGVPLWGSSITGPPLEFPKGVPHEMDTGVFRPGGSPGRAAFLVPKRSNKGEFPRGHTRG
jgi:hypothetical protein